VVRSYREAGKAKQDVVHLGEHATADGASAAWAEDVQQLRTTRPRKADKLRAKMDRFKARGCGRHHPRGAIDQSGAGTI